MFYTYKYLYQQPAVRLNKHLLYFFRKLRSVTANDQFKTDETLFHSEFVVRLNHHRSNELRVAFKHFFDAYKALLPLEKLAVLKQFDDIQNVSNWLTDSMLSNRRIENRNLPISLRQPAKDLFLYLYKNTLKIDLAKHYKALYRTLPNKYCPFCALYKLPYPDDRKADYDHWLCKADYPFLSVSMHNLVPVCERCNQIYKKEQNIIVDEVGQRRQFLDPFSQSYELRVDLTGSILPDANSQNSNWSISFSPYNNIVENWSKVFCIEQRYEKELNDEFTHWTGVFIKEYKTRVVDIVTLKQAFQSHAQTFDQFLYRQSNIIKHGLFAFLAECDDYTYYNAVLRDMAAYNL